MSANVPIVATSVGDVARILKQYDGSLCRPNDKKDLKEKIKKQMAKKSINYRRTAELYGWEKLSKRLDLIISESIKNHNLHK